MGLGQVLGQGVGPAGCRGKLSYLVTRKLQFSQELTCPRSHCPVPAVFSSQSCPSDKDQSKEREVI